MAVCPGPTATSYFEGVSTKMKDGAFDSAELVVRRTLRSFEQKKSIHWLTTYDEMASRPDDRIVISWDIALSEIESGIIPHVSFC
jgi:short-subunit dehydrogenase